VGHFKNAPPLDLFTIMTTANIRLLPLETPTPRPGYIPYRYARHWRSVFELANPIQPSIAVFMTQKAYIRANVHAQSDLDNEIGGWMIGSWRADQNTGEEFIVVERCLPALHALRGSAYITFTQDSQVAMFEIMEEKFPDKELVGWYHSHPKMSVFLSSYDLFLHNSFFPHPWQVALVLEPHSTTAGFFIRDADGNLDNKAYYGFHELTLGRYQSVVRWANMKEEITGSPGVMENEDE
jgi:proteasome lid subunit RPN8/RPN11